jgi:pseudouridine-5'-phosphate glycosidase
VLGWQHDWFPAFYLRSSGLRVPHRVDTARVVADVLRGRTRERTGVLLTVPIPSADELAPGPLNDALDAALAACEAAHVTGAAVTPFVLDRIERHTAGASVPANLALAENNARVAAQVAVALSGALRGPRRRAGLLEVSDAAEFDAVPWLGGACGLVVERAVRYAPGA